VGTEPAQIVAAATQLLSNPAAYQMMATAINPFGDGRAAEQIFQIVEILISGGGNIT